MEEEAAVPERPYYPCCSLSVCLPALWDFSAEHSFNFLCWYYFNHLYCVSLLFPARSVFACFAFSPLRSLPKISPADGFDTALSRWATGQVSLFKVHRWESGNTLRGTDCISCYSEVGPKKFICAHCYWVKAPSLHPWVGALKFNAALHFLRLMWNVCTLSRKMRPPCVMMGSSAWKSF